MENVEWVFEGGFPQLWWEQVLGDDVEGGKLKLLWMRYQPEPQRVCLEEVNGRLELKAQAAKRSETVDATCVPNGMGLGPGDAWLGNLVVNAGRVELSSTALIDATGSASSGTNP